MNYGFVIDNRKCIGCHACTVACKSEHDVPVGVNRTWVKQTEKGVFPDTKRLFSVLRCNHCEDAPCVTICPVEALYTREDGIVDFNNDRCIGCKSCMQACPYDALYIDPNTQTAAKCNYCAPRIDVGLEPACVNVCPEHAIISGDLDNPNTEIAHLVSREQVTVRKPEKSTKPNVYYIDGDLASLNPSTTERSDRYFWNSQSSGVGHYARFVEGLAKKNDPANPSGEVQINTIKSTTTTYAGNNNGQSCSAETEKNGLNPSDARRIYDTPDKGILWGWEVSGYVLTKAISAGAFLVAFVAMIFNFSEVGETTIWISVIAGLGFLGATGVLLIMDLDQPKRFLYVLLRPQWKSWLVRGGYSISIYGALLSLLGLFTFLEMDTAAYIVMWAAAVIAIMVAIYTAFLFAQAKGRDFWQSPTLAIHMLVHSFMAGAAFFSISNMVFGTSADWSQFLSYVLYISIGINLFVMIIELTMTHPTEDSRRVSHMITGGCYKNSFWIGTVLIGNVLPLVLVYLGGGLLSALAGVLVIIGIYITEKIWIEAPQRIQLT
jgi:Fe-S-cluster-containing dehydrogenase component/formate-dependent nitrite reductase membrane component NrfD